MLEMVLINGVLQIVISKLRVELVLQTKLYVHSTKIIAHCKYDLIKNRFN